MKYLIIVVILNICYSQVEYSKDLIEGYNWFSINLLTDDMSTNSILSSLNENPSYIISQQNGFSIYYQGFGWYGRLQELNAENMYKILMLGNATLSYSGQIMDTNEHTILLNEGWTIGSHTKSHKNLSLIFLYSEIWEKTFFAFTCFSHPQM